MKRGRHYTIPVFIPEAACPFQCVYCDQRRISGTQSMPSEKEIIEIIESHLKTIPWKESHAEIGFFGGSFTGLPEQDQGRYLDLIQPYLEKGMIRSVRLSTRPDYINQRNLKMLVSYGVKTIELGAQSMDEEVLKLSRRGHTASDTAVAAKLIKEAGFRLGLQMMTGLPGDTMEKTIETARKIIDLNADDARIYPLLVIRNTILHNWYNQGKYTPLGLEEAIERCKSIVPLFEEAGVNIIRVGLHPSDELLDGSSIIAGPFHVSFRELVMTEVWKSRLSPLAELSGNRIDISVPAGERNYAIGHKASNKKLLEQRFAKVRFHSSDSLERGRFEYL